MVTNKIAYHKIDKRKSLESNMKDLIERLGVDMLSAYDAGNKGNDYQRGKADAFCLLHVHLKDLAELL